MRTVQQGLEDLIAICIRHGEERVRDLILELTIVVRSDGFQKEIPANLVLPDNLGVNRCTAPSTRR